MLGHVLTPAMAPMSPAINSSDQEMSRYFSATRSSTNVTDDLYRNPNAKFTIALPSTLSNGSMPNKHEENAAPSKCRAITSHGKRRTNERTLREKWSITYDSNVPMTQSTPATLKSKSRATQRPDSTGTAPDCKT